MIVAVASKNPTKITATERAFKKCFPDETIKITSLDVPSGVADQPLSMQETITGACNRAKAASGADYDYAVGIEGGIHFMDVDGQEHAIETGWACVLDCDAKRYQLAASPSFPILPNVVSQIRTGLNLSDAMQAEYGLENLGVLNGYVGWLTDDILDRTSICYDSVLLALCTLQKGS